VAAQLQHQPDRETLVLTVTLGNCEKPKERP
jgi:hypothetical protein